MAQYIGMIYYLDMKITRIPLFDKSQTADEIQRLINDYYDDLYFINTTGGKRVSDLSLENYFNLVKNIPYRRDRSPKEVVLRPAYVFMLAKQGMDCKKKSIVCGAFCKLNGIDYRAVGSSRRPDKKIHHIFIETKIDGKFLPMDATYSHNKLYEPKKGITNKEVFFYG
jgi:hypothetical protein